MHFGITNSKSIKTTLILTAIVLLPTTKASAFTDLYWGAGSGSPGVGDQYWNVAGNWTSDNIPNSGAEQAFIGDTTSDRNIITPSTPTTIGDLDFTQTSNAVNKITLGNDLTLTGYQPGHYHNSSSSISNMVIDLNGYTLNEPLSVNGNIGQVSYQTSAPGGTLKLYSLYYGGSIIGPGVTVELSTGSSFYPNATFDPTSRLVLAPGSGTSSFFYGGTLGHLDIGKDGAATEAKLAFQYGYALTTLGDVNIYAPTGSNNANLQLYVNADGYFYAHGNFIDHGAATAAGYGTGYIYFTGAPVTPRTVSIARTTLTNHFYVGNPSVPSDTGNIKLDQDLATTGAFAVTANSRLDLDVNTLNVGSFTGSPNMKLALSFGADDGVVNVTNTLTLNAFTLDLNFIEGGGYVDGQDLVLFTYGSLSGTPSVTLGNVPATFHYDQLLTNGGSVRLTNIFVPEPASLALLAVGGLLLMRGRR